MRKARLWLASVGVGVALVIACAAAEKTSSSEAQILTRAAPSAAGDGFDISRWSAYRVSMCPVGNDEILTGTVATYVYNDTAAQWGRNKRQDLTVRGPGWKRCEVFDDSRAGYRGPARILPAAEGVTLSDGGTTVMMRVDGWIE